MALQSKWMELQWMVHQSKLLALQSKWMELRSMVHQFLARSCDPKAQKC
jgi:hypothetical protein